MILLSNSIIYIIFGILLQLLVEVRSQPGLREAHTATSINDKLYILGGGIPPKSVISPKETFLYLDVSVPFDISTNELKWNDFSYNNIVPLHLYATAVKGGENNATLLVYGGFSISNQIMNLVYTFNTQSSTWSIPKITGIPPTENQGLTAVVDYNGLIYLFGGAATSPVITYTNDMFVLDLINLSWKKVSSINAPSPRTQYGAVFLPNQNIIYIGGFNKDLGVFPLNEVYLYDTKNDIWTRKTTNGLSPSPRSSFTIVLGLDGQRVIVFGGVENNATPLSPENSLYVLDLNDFNWYVPKVTGNIPSSRAFHKTVLIGKYMVVTFGRGYTQGVESDILLLDISNNGEYIWTTSFVPLPPPVPSSPVSPSPAPPSTNPSTPLTSSSNNTGVIVGSVIGSLFGGILLTVGSFFLYRRYKNIKEQNRAVPTPGESNQYPQEIIQIPRDRTTYYQSQQVPLSQFQPIYNHR